MATTLLVRPYRSTMSRLSEERLTDQEWVAAETAVPYHAFKNAGCDVKFATEQGKIP